MTTRTPNLTCRVAESEADLEAFDRVHRLVRTGDVDRPAPTPAIWPGAAHLLLWRHDEPIAITRIERRTPDTRLRIEQMFEEVGDEAGAAAFAKSLERYLPEYGVVACVMAWEVVPSARAVSTGVPPAGVILGAAVRYCQLQGLYRIYGEMELGTRQQRFVPLLARGEEVCTTIHSVWKTKHQIWTADLRTLEQTVRRFVDEVAAPVLQL